MLMKIPKSALKLDNIHRDQLGIRDTLEVIEYPRYMSAAWPKNLDK